MTINAIGLITKTAACPTLGDWAIKHKQTVKWGKAKKGDIVLYDFNGNGTSDHVGIVTKVASNYIETVEGNTGNGSNTNGDGVYRRTRKKDPVNYFVRPKYTDKVTADMIVNTALAQVGYKEGSNNNNKYGRWFGVNNQPWCMIFVCWCFAHVLGSGEDVVPDTYVLDVDGDWGYLTTRTTQHILGVKETGVLNKATWKAIQKKVGLTGKDVDGVEGEKTDTAMQKYLKKNGSPSLKVDGERGTKTNKAWQKWCNAQLGVKTTTKTTAKATTKAKKCIDVSYWQGKITQANWKKVKNTCDYAICRTSYTSQSAFSLHADSTFATSYENAHKAGLKVGAYHYSQAKTVAEAKKEAQYMCDILKKHTAPTFYVVCDYEFGGRLNAKTASKASAVANAFCDVVKANGYKPCIYANTSTLNNYLTNPKYPVWVAQYASKCTYTKDKVMWQYTSSGSVSGISGKVDLSHVYEA